MPSAMDRGNMDTTLFTLNEQKNVMPQETMAKAKKIKTKYCQRSNGNGEA